MNSLATNNVRVNAEQTRSTWKVPTTRPSLPAHRYILCFLCCEKDTSDNKKSKGLDLRAPLLGRCREDPFHAASRRGCWQEAAQTPAHHAGLLEGYGQSTILESRIALLKHSQVLGELEGVCMA